MKKKQGFALISIVSTIAIALIVVSAATVISIINVKISLNKQQSQKANQAAVSLLNDAVLKFIRQREVVNQYPDWTENCLQINNIQCKMETDLTVDGGTIDAWVKDKDILKHLQISVKALEDNSVSVSAAREID